MILRGNVSPTMITISLGPVDLYYDPYNVLPTQILEHRVCESHGNNISISEDLDIKTDTSFLRGGYQLLWVHNGTQLNLENSRYNASLVIESETHVCLTLEILNFTESDTGLYIGVVNSEPSMLFSHFGCSHNMHNLRLAQIPVGFVLLSVKNSSKELINLHAMEILNNT